MSNTMSERSSHRQQCGARWETLNAPKSASTYIAQALNKAPVKLHLLLTVFDGATYMAAAALP